MRSIWKTAAAIAVCVAAIAGIGFGWRAYRTRMKLVETARLTRERAEQGDAQAQSNLSGMYYYGTGVPQSYVDAVNWARKAANQGNARGQYRLGYLYTYGQGVQQDYTSAFQWYLKAADQGYAEAQVDVGSLYYYGEGVPQDYAAALLWYRKAADQGSARGETYLGDMYYNGKAVPQDYAEAARWYRKAVDRGNARAKYYLGYMELHARGVPPNRDEGRRLLREAAAMGDKYALLATRVNMTILIEATLVLQFLGGLFFAVAFVPIRLNYFSEQPRKPWTRSQGLTTAGGVLILLGTAYGWYGYSHLKFQRLFFGPNSWVIGRWLSEAAALAVIFYILRQDRKLQAENEAESRLA